MDWRNPFEDFRDKYLSFANVKAYKLWLIRWGYIPYSPDRVTEYNAKVLDVWGSAEDVPLQFFWAGQTYRDMGVKKGIQPWITKFFNARFSLHVGVSIWKGWLPLPFLGVVIRLTERRYFQFGGIFGPEGKYDKETNTFERATICGKFRLAEYVSEYTEGGNFDVYGFYEGIC